MHPSVDEMQVKEANGCKEKRVYNDPKPLNIYNISKCGVRMDGDEKRSLSTLARRALTDEDEIARHRISRPWGGANIAVALQAM
jgi:hypothetical protein